MTKTILRGSTTADLLAIPAVIFGFHPLESVVVIAFQDQTVEFAARVDLGLQTVELGVVLRQIECAARRIPNPKYAVLGFGCHPAKVANDVEHIRNRLSPVVAALVTNGASYWESHDLEGPGTPHDFRASQLAAESAYAGIRPASSRNQAVQEVQPPPVNTVARIAEYLDEVDTQMELLDSDERLQRLQVLCETSGSLSTPERAELVCLLQDDEAVGEVLSQLRVASAGRMRRRLIEARAMAVGQAALNVLGLLGIACWLSGAGAQQSECMQQMSMEEKEHPLLIILRRLHGSGIPPADWSFIS